MDNIEYSENNSLGRGKPRKFFFDGLKTPGDEIVFKYTTTQTVINACHYWQKTTKNIFKFSVLKKNNTITITRI